MSLVYRTYYTPDWPLICISITVFLLSGAEATHPSLLVQVPAPESVGEEAALKSPFSKTLSNFSLTNINTEIKNIL